MGRQPGLRPRQASGAVPSSSSSPNPKLGNIGPLSVSALAGLVAAAFALFVLGIWLAVILLRRKRRRRRRRKAALPLKGRESEKDREGKGRLDPNVDEGTEETGEMAFKRMDSSGTHEEYKYDPTSAFDRRDPSSSTSKSDPHSIVLPSSSFSPSPFPAAPSPFSAQIISHHSPGSNSPLYTSPLTSAGVFHASPSSSRQSPSSKVALPSANPNLLPNQPPSTSASPQPGRPSPRTRTPSNLSKSFSIVDVPPLSELPELCSQEQITSPTSAMTRSKSGSQHRPRKLEKKRRSGSLRRSTAGEGISGSHPRNTLAGAGSGSEREGKAGGGSDKEGGQKAPDEHLRHAPSLQQVQSDSDQSTRTVVPLVRSRSTPRSTPTAASAIFASTTPPSSYYQALSQATSYGSLDQAASSGSLRQPPASQTLSRQRSGIRQPGDPHHLRPPKESSPSSHSESATRGALSQAASSGDHSQATVVPSDGMSSLTPQQAASLLAGIQQPLPSQHPVASTSTHTQPPLAAQPKPSPTRPVEHEILAFHKAAGNLPKPFKPFAFQFPPPRSPSGSNSSQPRSHASSNASNTRPLVPNPVANPQESAGPSGSANDAGNFAALLAAAGLSMSPSGSPSPSPIGRNSTDMLSMQPGRGSTEMLAAFPGRGSTEMLAAFPGRTSTDVLSAFPHRSSTDALNNFGNGESRQSLQSGYSLDVPFEGGQAAASSPSAFSFSTDLYGYGGPGPASASNSIDLYRPVDPSTLFPGGVPGVNNNGIDMEGRHSLSLLGGEPLSPAELDSRGLRIRRFREGHASVSSFAAFNMNPSGVDEGRRTRTPSWTLEALRENLFGSKAHRRGQDSVASSSAGSQSHRSSVMPWTGLGVNVGPPALASPRDANFQFSQHSQQPISPSTLHPEGAHYAFNGNAGGGETRVRTVVRAFTPLMPDELVLRPGEELAVLQEFDDRWCVVAREGLGSNGAPTPPGLDNDDPVTSNVAADGQSTTGSSGSARSRKRVLEVGVCPIWVFDEAPPPGQRREYERPMRSTSLSITVSMKLPPLHLSPVSARDSPREGSLALRENSYPISAGDRPSISSLVKDEVRGEVISWSNF